MKPTIAISLLLLPLAWGQAAPEAGKRTMLILLRQPEGSLGKRLAELPGTTQVPEEVRMAAAQEQRSMIEAQLEALEKRMTAAGATGVVRYVALNMMRAEVPAANLNSFETDPAVVSLTPVSGDSRADNVNLGVGVQPPAGVGAGGRGRRSEAFQPPPPLGSGLAAGGMFMPVPQAPPPMIGAPPPPGMGMGMPGPGGTLQSIMGVTGQMGMAGGAMPRAAGMVALLAGGAQIAQIIAANWRQGCTVVMAAAGTHVAAGGGQGTIAVNVAANCFWQAQSDADWLMVNTDGPTMGPGIVKFTVGEAGGGKVRTGEISIAGVAGTKVKGRTSVTVRQD